MKASLLEYLGVSRPSADPSEFKTAQELASETGNSQSWVNKKLRELHLRGKLEVIKAEREGISGTMAKVPAYRMKEEDKS